MFYKKDDSGKWWDATTVHLPSGDVLAPKNKKSLDGWFWSDNPPQEYLEWEEEQNQNDLFFSIKT